MKGLVWISFDLGVRGDYESLFRFLDAHQAKECGDNLAVLHFEGEEDAITELQREIMGSVNLDKRSRIYIIYPSGKTGSYKGRFIKGGRKSPPWAGYATADSQEEDANE